MNQLINGGSLMEQDAKKWSPATRSTEIANGGNGLRLDQVDYQIQLLSQELSNLSKESDQIQKRRLEILSKMSSIRATIDKLISEYKVPEFLAKHGRKATQRKDTVTARDVEKELAKLSPEARERFFVSVKEGSK